ncbi:MAG: hypothetical protein ACOYN0_03265 [Phycisphaerales bacterium]
MTFERGEIPGATERGRAERVAHLLARLGVVEIDLGGQRVRARETDLPGLLIGKNEQELGAGSGRAMSIRVGPGAATWSTEDPDLAAAIRRITKEVE